MTNLGSDNTLVDKPLVIDGKTYQSRLLVGTGKYQDLDETREAIAVSGAEIVTVAVRRTNIGQNPGEPNLLDVISPDKYTILPNTAGCYTAKDAVRTCKLARELLGGHELVKLEVLGDQKTLYPDITETLIAAEELIKDGFKVMVYTTDDPIIAKRLEEMGCVAVMPLGAPIGSGLGIRNPYNIRRIGSAAIDICWVAMGRLDGFYESLSPWDFAAARLIAEEAGAQCGHFSELPEPVLEALYGEDILIATPELYSELRTLLSRA